MGLPISNTALPIVLPTLYLWIVDTLALKRGTWVIESGTKLGINLWDGLEIESVMTAPLKRFSYRLTSAQGSPILPVH